jgi:hypothetical protein
MTTGSGTARMRGLLACLAVGLCGLASAVAAWPAGKAGHTTRVSLKENGKEVPGANSEYAAISGDGRFIAFESDGELLKKDDPTDHDVYLFDRQAKHLSLMSVNSNGGDGNNVECAAADISPNGRYVSFGCGGALLGSDNNGIPDVYRHDRETGKTVLVSVTDAGSQLSGGNDAADISGVANNGAVAWESDGAFVGNDTNGDTDLFVRNPGKSHTRRATVNYQDNQLTSGGESDKDSKIAISGNGRFVAFQTFEVATADPDTAFGLNGMDSDVFVRDLKEGRTSRVSLKSNGDEALTGDNANNFMPSISTSGRFVAFQATAPFVGNDDNNTYDIYVRDRKDHKTYRASVKSNGGEVTPPGLPNQYEEISSNGRYVVWDTSGNYGGGPDPMDFRDVYWRDTKAKKTKLVSVKSNGGRADQNQLADVSNNGWVPWETMEKLTGQNDDSSDWDVFLRGAF